MVIIEAVNGNKYTVNPERLVIVDTGSTVFRHGRTCQLYSRDFQQAIEITHEQAMRIEQHMKATDLRARQIEPADVAADLELVEAIR